jgi:hypothetical protein
MFCQSCGAQMTGAFCTKCGARAAQPPSAPPPSPAPPPSYNPEPPPYNPAPPPAYQPPPQAYSAPQPLPPAAKSGSGLKILLIVLAVFAFLGVLLVGGLMYGWHKVKETAASKGIDLNDLSDTQRTPGRRIDACELLTKEELSAILKMPIDRTEGNGKSTNSNCKYFSNSAQDKAATDTTEALKRLTEAGGNNSSDQAAQEKAMKEMGSVIRGISGSQANGMVLSIEIQTENAKSAMAAFKIAMAAMTMGQEKNKALREDIQGVGDEAIMGPLASLFMVRKGNTSIGIDGRALTAGRDAQIEIAKAIVAKL